MGSGGDSTGDGRSRQWRDVDASGVAEDMITYLDRAAEVTSALRAESVELLRLNRGATVLDAGCGTGVAAVELADLVGPDGTVHAIDPSTAMVERTVARSAARSISARVGDVRSIQLPDNSCDGARTERVLIHLSPAESQTAIAELVRVVRPGGRVSLVETCHVQCRIDGDDIIMPRVAEVVSNPAMGIQMRAALLTAGCNEVVSYARPLTFTSIAALRPVVRLEVVARAAKRAGAANDEVESVLAEMDRRDHSGTFFAVMMFYVAAGTVTP